MYAIAISPVSDQIILVAFLVINNRLVCIFGMLDGDVSQTYFLASCPTESARITLHSANDHNYQTILGIRMSQTIKAKNALLFSKVPKRNGMIINAGMGMFAFSAKEVSKDIITKFCSIL